MTKKPLGTNVEKFEFSDFFQLFRPMKQCKVVKRRTDCNTSHKLH